jgi:CO/xanthine dehydrogenase Mo-binding subunit
MADTKHFGGKVFGQNYTTPDLVAKVTGKARYAEDWRVEGMLFAKLLCSPMPHARVTRLDLSRAQAMPGVKAIITDDDLPKPAAGGTLGEGVQATAQGERGLTMEPLYQGEPILAVAAVDEKTAAEAIEAIDIEFEPLPFVVDAIESLRPNGANARAQGNVWVRPTAPPAAPGARGPSNDARGAGTQAPPAAAGSPAPGAAAGAAPGAAAGRGRGGAPAGPPPPQIAVWKWTDDDFKNAGDGQMPLGKATDEWTFGKVDDAMKSADLVLDETFMTQSTGHQPLETRSAMAYWQNG